MKKHISPLLSLIAASTLIVHTKTHANDLSDFGKGLAFIGATAVAAGAVIWACNQEESDTDLINRAQSAYTRPSLVFIATESANLLPYTHYFYTMPEYDIEHISASLLSQTTVRNLYENTLGSLEIYSELIQTLTARIYKIDRHYAPEKAYTIELMRALILKLEKRTLLINKTLKPFLDAHKHYLYLFEEEQKLHKRYADELSSLCDAPKNSSTAHAIKKAIYNKYYNNKYPYSAYLATVKEDIARFAQALNTLTRDYPQREKMAYWVKEQLEYIRSIITTSIQLERESMQKEWEKLERREQEIEKKNIQKKREKLAKKERKYLRSR